MKIIGRTKEQLILDKLLISHQAEFAVIYGRRRVGKTFLVRQHLNDQIVFDFSGAFEVELDLQLDNFFSEYLRCTKGKKETNPPTSWQQAFLYISNFLKSLRRKGKIVVFIDEIAWLDTPKSGFMAAFEYFWNQHGSKMDNLLLVACGSAASWIQRKLLKAKGGLYNRVTKRINLQPFTLAETEAYCKHHNIKLTRYQIIQLYMVMGGIPFYLKELTSGKSVVQLIDEICFSPDGLLADEYEQLYYSIFKNPEDHIAIIEALANKPNGLVRNDVIKFSGLPDGGSFTRPLKNLIACGFISGFTPFGKKKKDMVYRLIDLYSLFYLKFIQGKVSNQPNKWQTLKGESSYIAWSGYAFENICMIHVPQIHKSLGIGGVYTQVSSWKFKGNKELSGAQVDLVIDRNDGIVHLCEAKFTQNEFIISKNYIANLRHKRTAFEHTTKTKKAVVTSLLTTYPAVKNAYYLEEVHSEVSMEDLFL